MNALAVFLERHERGLVAALCVAAAVRVFVSSAGFPFFAPQDEVAHFDLVVKYARYQVPTRFERYSQETRELVVLYQTPEYLSPPPTDGRVLPPLWTAPPEIRETVLRDVVGRVFPTQPNHESAEPPLYYAVVGGWYLIGKALAIHRGQLVYWCRFLNVVVIVALVWLSHAFARRFFPDGQLFRLGVPLLVAFIPQDSFYYVNNDVPSPLLCAAALYALLGIALAPKTRPTSCLVAGTLVAAALLTKLSNLPIVVALLATVFMRLSRPGARHELRDLFVLATATVVPVAAWSTRTYLVFGDVTGQHQKATLAGWTPTPLAEIFRHPIFSPVGFAAFFHDLMATFWRGELMWHRATLALSGLDLIYSISSALFVTLAVVAVCRQANTRDRSELVVTWTSIAVVAASVLFLAALSPLFDYGSTWRPSRSHPYYSVGRLMSGALVPFVALYLRGLEWGLARVKLQAAGLAIVAGFMVAVTASEILLSAKPFQSQFNWFHMLGGP